MIRKLQTLKAKRGFTMIELVVVIAIIGIMVSTILVGSNNKRDRIKSANSAAADFYSVIQTQFTNFQMFDGPLTMTLSKQYLSDPAALMTDERFGGVKYFPALGGNYPFLMDNAPETVEEHRNDLPSSAFIAVEVRILNGKVRYVEWANDAEELFEGSSGSKKATSKTELSAVLELGLKDKIELRDGYYYALIYYSAPSGVGLTMADYKTRSTYVTWAAFTENRITGDSSTYTFKTQNTSEAGRIIGVSSVTSLITPLGTPGTNLAGNI
ncbi:MAG: type II secretion system GspH family protein [Oscillospiraceae bacterium]|nr:type II secretion system GspH family protein [Oscillospiraceae bacterium]